MESECGLIPLKSPWSEQKSLQVIGQKIGQGSFGKVWKAQHTVEKNYYAIKQVFVTKTLEYNGGDVEKLRREIDHLLTIESPHVVKYSTCWGEGPWVTNKDALMQYTQNSSTQRVTSESEVNFLFIQMELCDSTLKTWLEDNSFSDRKAQIPNILGHLAQGLLAIHKENIIHRDLKPDNIFLNGTVWKIGDLGLSIKSVETKSGTHATTSIAGNQAYRSPEMENQGYSVKSDVFSMGLIFLEVLHSFANAEINNKKLKLFYDLGHKNSTEIQNTAINLIPACYQKEKKIVRKMIEWNPEFRIDSKQVLEQINEVEIKVQTGRLQQDDTIHEVDTDDDKQTETEDQKSLIVGPPETEKPDKKPHCNLLCALVSIISVIFLTPVVIAVAIVIIRGIQNLTPYGPEKDSMDIHRLTSLRLNEQMNSSNLEAWNTVQSSMRRGVCKAEFGGPIGPNDKVIYKFEVLKRWKIYPIQSTQVETFTVPSNCTALGMAAIDTWNDGTGAECHIQKNKSPQGVVLTFTLVSQLFRGMHYILLVIGDAYCY